MKINPPEDFAIDGELFYSFQMSLRDRAEAAKNIFIFYLGASPKHVLMPFSAFCTKNFEALRSQLRVD